MYDLFACNFSIIGFEYYFYLLCNNVKQFYELALQATYFTLVGYDQSVSYEANFGQIMSFAEFFVSVKKQVWEYINEKY